MISTCIKDRRCGPSGASLKTLLDYVILLKQNLIQPIPTEIKISTHVLSGLWLAGETCILVAQNKMSKIKGFRLQCSKLEWGKTASRLELEEHSENEV
jgi:hypothetical protein